MQIETWAKTAGAKSVTIEAIYSPGPGAHEQREHLRRITKGAKTDDHSPAGFSLYNSGY